MKSTPTPKTSQPLWLRGFCACALWLLSGPNFLLGASAFALSGCGDEAVVRQSGPEERVRPEGMSDIEWGEWLYGSYGCVACHSLTGIPSVGPPLEGLAGTERVLVDGTTTIADASYLQAAILQPDEHRVAGYEAQMPSYGLSYPQVDALVAYLQYLAGVSAEAP